MYEAHVRRGKRTSRRGTKVTLKRYWPLQKRAFTELKLAFLRALLVLGDGGAPLFLHMEAREELPILARLFPQNALTATILGMPPTVVNTL